MQIRVAIDYANLPGPISSSTMILFLKFNLNSIPGEIEYFIADNPKVLCLVREQMELEAKYSEHSKAL